MVVCLATSSISHARSFAGEMRSRRLVVLGEILHVSSELKRGLATVARRSEWGSFKRLDAEWRETVRFKRLRGGASTDFKAHVGRRPLNDPGARWMVRLSQDENGPPPKTSQVAANDGSEAFKVSVERVGAHLASHVTGATKLPNGRTIEVMAHLIEAKRHVRFEELTWPGSRGKAAPIGRFVVRDERGLTVARGDLRWLWRQARLRDGRWATRTLGLRVGELQELLVDLTN
jgi:hypothetical protein